MTEIRRGRLQARGDAQDQETNRFLVKIDNLYLVPVLRNRLCFALLFRKALEQISESVAWDGSQDLICISLPPTIQAAVTKGIHKLPWISQIWTESSNNSAKEIFSVTPCDALIEAARLAMERDWSVRFIDLDVMPGNIMRHPCQRDPSWPDDSFVQLIGIEKYMGLVYPQLTQVPMRFEPVDTWREAHIAQRLRELYPCWRRVLFVCDMSIIVGIRASLTGSGMRTAAPTTGQPASTRLQDSLNLPVLLNYLDDFPRLVEVYERRRKQLPEGVASLDKRDMLLDEVQRFLSTTRDIAISTRQVEKFSIFLKNHLALNRRRVPDPETLFCSVQGCFGTAIAERLHCHLSGYSDQIAVERVRPRHAKESERFRYMLDVKSYDAKYESRECDPTPPAYDVIPAITLGHGKSGLVQYDWPKEEIFLKAMHAKLVGLAKKLEPNRVVHRFQGNIERGIDARQTLRSIGSPLPIIYVKGFKRVLNELDTEREPVLWILSDDFEAHDFSIGSGHFTVSDDARPLTGSKPGLSFYISWQDFIKRPDSLEEVRLLEDERTNISIFGLRRQARITFGNHFETEEAARAAYGDSFEQRVPNHKDFEHPEDVGCVLPELVQAVNEGATWFEIAALTAARYAAQSVLVVVSAGMQLPPSITSNTLCSDKKFVFFPLESFSKEERDKLRINYQFQGEQDSESNWPNIMRLMTPFWPAQ